MNHKYHIKLQSIRKLSRRRKSHKGHLLIISNACLDISWISTWVLLRCSAQFTFATACAVCSASFVVLLERLEFSSAGLSIFSISETLFITSGRTFSCRGFSFFIAALVWACRWGHSLAMSEWRFGPRFTTGVQLDSSQVVLNSKRSLFSTPGVCWLHFQEFMKGFFRLPAPFSCFWMKVWGDYITSHI